MNPNNQRIATTPEQSQSVIALGVDLRTADMTVDVDTGKLYIAPYSTRVDKAHEIPAWSLGALLNLLPQELNGYDLHPVYAIAYPPMLTHGRRCSEIFEVANFGELDGQLQIICDNGFWTVDYSKHGFVGDDLPCSDDPIEAVVDAIRLLRANKVPLAYEILMPEPEEPSSEPSAEEDDDLPF